MLTEVFLHGGQTQPCSHYQGPSHPALSEVHGLPATGFDSLIYLPQVVETQPQADGLSGHI